MQYEKATFEKILVGKIRELAEDMGCNCFITGCCLSLSLSCSLTPSLCLCLSVCLSLSLLSFSFSPFSLSFPSSDSLSSLNPQPKLKPGIFLQEASRDLKEACASDPKKSTPEPVKAEKPRKETPKGRSKLQEEKGSDSEGSSAAPVPGAMKAIKDAKPGRSSRSTVGSRMTTQTWTSPPTTISARASLPAGTRGMPRIASQISQPRTKPS